MNSCAVCGGVVQSGVAVCRRCLDHLADQLAGADDLAEDLDVAVTRQARFTTASDQIIGKSSGQRLPFNPAIAEAIDLLAGTLSAWASDLARGSNHAPSSYATVDPHDPARIPNRLTTVGFAARVLSDHLDALVRHPNAATAHDEITYALRSARNAIDRPVPRRYLGKCGTDLDEGRCDTDLYAPVDHATVACPSCGERWDTAHLYAVLLDRAPTAAGTTSTIAGWLRLAGFEVSSQTVRRWARDQRLDPVGEQRGRPLYRLGDVLRTYHQVHTQEKVAA